METTAVTIDKRAERIRDMFAGIAPRYDLLNSLLSLRIDRRWRARVVRETPPDHADSAPILDVCTGTGELALAFAAAHPNNVVIGTDFCRPMLEIAKAKAAKLPDAARRPEFMEADALSLPFPSDRFQVASIAFGLRNVADFRAGLAELARVVQPGGRVAVLEFSRPRTPILKHLYLAYFKQILPRIGQRVSPNREAAYEYLPASVMAFPDGEELADELRAVGLEKVSTKPLTFGIAALTTGRKPLTSSR
ncbi:MAG TPA: bifunctional demethylmenaquinone methyltransferase/2-methoxy-6-polyprenyl-1,4-benzoquinol methylase UbiE [Planctomycetia bacterium]|nr:bifunctional demethylmenaquinone methyltransferase/2-methoxy-6-polyprenyl-1,4-benzoquinol methylase UbiE [Planctomycetia bacterium]